MLPPEAAINFANLALLTVVAGTASGLRPYLTVLAMALLRNLGPGALPEYTHWLVNLTPQALGHPLVVLLAGGMTIADFTLDKIPALAQVWGVAQLVLRPLAAIWLGAQLGAGAGTAGAVLGGVSGAVPAAVVGFGKSSATAALPLGTGLGFGKSVLDDGVTMTLLWLLVRHPVVAAVLSVLVLVFSIWLGLRLWRVTRSLARRVLHLKGQAQDRLNGVGATMATRFAPHPMQAAALLPRPPVDRRPGMARQVGAPQYVAQEAPSPVQEQWQMPAPSPQYWRIPTAPAEGDTPDGL